MNNNRLEGKLDAPSSEPQVAGDTLAASVNVGRRRLFRGVGGGAGVLLAVSARSALGAGVCKSPSAMMSGNTSPRPGNGSTCSGGLSPGYWVQPQHSPNWATAGATFPQFNGQVVSCTTNLNKVAFADISAQGTTLQSIFTGWAPLTVGVGDVSMWWVINEPHDAMFGGKDGVGQLLRHLSCAWLNAGFFKNSAASYPMTQAQVVDIWVQLKNKGSYCPGNVTCSKPWSPADVISYIENMYDQNAPVDNVCKKP